MGRKRTENNGSSSGNDRCGRFLQNDQYNAVNHVLTTSSAKRARRRTAAFGIQSAENTGCKEMQALLLCVNYGSRNTNARDAKIPTAVQTGVSIVRSKACSCFKSVMFRLYFRSHHVLGKESATRPCFWCKICSLGWMQGGGNFAGRSRWQE